MSTEATGVDGKITFRKYINVSFSIDDWCKYTGHCNVYNTIAGPHNLCIFCKYRMPLDIPKILDEEDSKDESNKN